MTTESYSIKTKEEGLGDLTLEIVSQERKSRLKKKKTKKKTNSTASVELYNNNSKDKIENLLSVSTESTAVMSVSPEIVSLHTEMLESRKKAKKTKKASKSKGKHQDLLYKDTIAGFESTHMSSIGELDEENRKLTPAEKNAAEKSNISIGSFESSIFSSRHDTAVLHPRTRVQSAWPSNGSQFEVADSVAGRLIGKSEDDRWSDFPESLPRGVNFSQSFDQGLQNGSQLPQMKELTSVQLKDSPPAQLKDPPPSHLKDPSPKHFEELRHDHIKETPEVRLKESSSQHPTLYPGSHSRDLITRNTSLEGGGGWDPYLRQEQAPGYQNNERLQQFDILDSNKTIVQLKAEEAMKSSMFSTSDISSKTKSSSESTALVHNNKEQKGVDRFPVPSVIVEEKGEEALRASSQPKLRSKNSFTPMQQKAYEAMRMSSNTAPLSYVAPVVKPGIDHDDVSENSAHSMPADMLVRYLRSMGTSYRTAVDIANRFREHQVMTPLPEVQPFSLVEPVATSSKLASIQNRPSNNPQGIAFAGSMATNNNPGQSQGRASRTRTRRSTQPFSWERSVQPGAVQMEGRAFGAPPRPVVAPTHPDEDDIIVETVEALEATTVEDVEHGPVVYADSTPLSWRDLLKEKSLRRRFFVLCFVLIAVVVVSVSLAFVRKPSKTEEVIDITIPPSSAPSSSPTLIAYDILTYTAQLSGMDVVSTPGTPQHSAVGWLSTFDTYSEGFSEFFSQRYAMATLYFSLGGENWLDQDDWMAPDKNECEWSSAIFCVLDGAGEEDRLLVSGLDLSRNGLSGTIPPEIGLLTQLGLLRLSKNQIQGSLPSELFSLSVLGVLDLHKNELTGAIPTNIGTEKDLVHLDLSYNQFTGSIPSGFTNLDLVRVADFSWNHFSGAIPSNLARLKVIGKLSLASNMFTGTIPEFTIDDLPGFDSINLGDNMLSGTLPDWTLALLTRQEVLLYHNLLTGSIPATSTNEFLLAVLADPSILDKVRVRSMDVSSNYLTGTIPALGPFMFTVEYIDFSNNKFNGSIPLATSQTRNEWRSLQTALFANNMLSGTVPQKIPLSLQFFDISGNLYEGSIPSDLAATNLTYFFIDDNVMLDVDVGELLSMAGNLVTLSARNTSLTGKLDGNDVLALENLEELNLGSNSITGKIPAELGTLKMIKKISLESNQLSGSIPLGIGLIPDLMELNLRYNVLSGTLPQSLTGLSSLTYLGLEGNEKLSGTVPEALCSNELLNLTREVIGCNLGCTCCLDPSGWCDNRATNSSSSEVFNRNRLQGR